VFNNFCKADLKTQNKSVLHTENSLSNMPGSDLKVCVVGGGGKYSNPLWLEPRLGQAKQ
jgi:hypothetical protein